MCFTLLIIFCLLNASLILASFFIHIPQCTTIIGGSLILLLLLIVLFKENNRKVLVISCSLSILSIAWGGYSTYCSPYWNSETIHDISGRNFISTLPRQSRLSSAEAERDIYYCQKIICKFHPLCTRGMDKKVGQYFNEAISTVNSQDSVSINELYILLQKAVASLKDAHTKVYAVNSQFRIANYSDCDEILEFGNIQFDSLAKEKFPFISSESYDWSRYQINQRLRDADGILSLGFSLDTAINIKYRSGKIIQEAILTEEDFTQKQSSKISMSADRIGGYTLSDSTSTAYLKLDNCYYYTLQSVHRFNNNIRNMFSEIKERGITNLILDLRNNPGGNQAIAIEFFKYLPIDKYQIGKNEIRRGPFLFQTNGIRRNRFIKDLCFNGNIYVLTSLQTFSAAMIFADMLQGNNLAIVIGEVPGNAATAYTNITHFVLPASRLSLNVSTLRRNKVDASTGSIFIVPDVPCISSEAYSKAVKIIADTNERQNNI